MEPTSEQSGALDAFVTRENVLISAGAGTGKTSTLRMLAGSTTRRGVYLAFNKSIAAEARRSFPATVVCRTAHSLAWAWARESPQGQLVLDRMQSRVPWQATSAELEITAMTLPTAVQAAHTFQASTVTRWVLDMVRAFCQSGDAELTAAHMAAIPAVAPEVTAQVGVELAPKASRVWQDVSSLARFAQPTHDTYLKMWQLGGASLPGEYVLFDEAQDANPVIAAVVATHEGQRVYVGDEAQAIYSFNGAVDAMSTFEAEHRLTLTQSWRFGQPIADAANTLLGLLEAPLRLSGNPGVTSRLIDASTTPDAVLCRTNSETIAQAIAAQRIGRRVHLMGGAAQAQRFVQGAAQLIETGRSPHPDLAAFSSWAEAREYALEDPRGRELVVLVSLVDEYGTDVLSDALRRCVPAESGGTDGEMGICGAADAEGCGLLAWFEYVSVEIFPGFADLVAGVESAESLCGFDVCRVVVEHDRGGCVSARGAAVSRDLPAVEHPVLEAQKVGLVLVEEVVVLGDRVPEGGVVGQPIFEGE